MQQQWRPSATKKDRMKLSLPPKLVEKLDWVPVISFCEIFIPSYGFDVLLCRSWRFLPPNRLTLRITLVYISKLLITSPTSSAQAQASEYGSGDTKNGNKANDKRRNRKPKKKIQNMQKAAPTTFSAQRQPYIESGECRTQEHGKIG